MVGSEYVAATWVSGWQLKGHGLLESYSGRLHGQSDALDTSLSEVIFSRKAFKIPGSADFNAYTLLGDSRCDQSQRVQLSCAAQARGRRLKI
jgi:hypothetical protein